MRPDACSDSGRPATTKITNIEQIVGSLVARVISLETDAASGSSSPDSTRSWNMLGHSDGSTATGSLGSHDPGSSDDNKNTRRRLDTSSSLEDEHARSAVLLRFPFEQYHTGITFGENQTFQSTMNPSESIAKQVLCRSGLYLKQEPNVKTLLLGVKMMVSPNEIDSPFCSARTTIAVRQSKSLEDREIGKQFAPLWRVLAEQLKILFPDGDDEGAFIVPALDTRSQDLSIKDRRNGIGKTCVQNCPFGSGQLFTLVASDLSIPGVPCAVLQRVISQANTASV